MKLSDQREWVRQRLVDWIRLAQYRRELPFLRELRCDRVSFSTRGAVVLGSSLNRCIGIVRRHAPIRGRSLLILGCGRGEEIHRWVRERPARILAVDVLDYREHWAAIAYPNVEFRQADLRTLATRERFDLIASKAVLEHVAGLETALGPLARLLRPGGHFWADFGPLYYTWGGAHAPLGYDHLLLPESEFAAKLDQPGCEEARLFWTHGLFSRLTYPQYMALLDAHFERRYVAVQICEEALRFRRTSPETFAQLVSQHGERDLLLKSVFYLGRKREA